MMATREHSDVYTINIDQKQSSVLIFSLWILAQSWILKKKDQMLLANLKLIS